MGNALSFLAFRGLGHGFHIAASIADVQIYFCAFPGAGYSRGYGRGTGIQPIISTNKRHYAALVWD